MTHTLVIFGPHLAVVFDSEEWLKDMLAKLRWDAKTHICHGTMQDRVSHAPAFCLDIAMASIGHTR
jgi:hypothetical protein